jgi:hypothetical protein
MKVEKKSFIAEVKSFDDKSLTIDHFISTETQDSGGDIMRADGMKMRGKPVVLFQHGQDPQKGMEPIAKILGISVGTNSAGKKGLIAKTQYYDGSKLTPPDNTGERLYQKAKQGFMPNWSIGWAPIKSSPTVNGGRDVTEWELHEYSQVAVGMNDEATCDIKSILGDQVLPVVQIKEEIPTEKEEEKLTALINEVESIPAEPKFFKSIIDHCALELPSSAIYTLNSSVMSELYNQARSSTETSDKIVSDLLTEYIGLVMPYMQAVIEACRTHENKEKTFDEIKALTSAKTEEPAAVPAPVAEPALEIIETPPVQEAVFPLADEKVLPILNTPLPEPKAQGIEIGCSVDDLKKAFSESIRDSVNLAIRQAQGRLD